MKQLWLAVVVVFGASSPVCPAAKVKVLTSFLPVYCFTVNIAGDLAEVENLLPPGATPHDFQLSPSDVAKYTDANLLIVNGLGVEPWLNKLTRHAKKTVITMAGGFSKDTNPHIWLDPVLAAHAVTNILRGLQSADPMNAEGYAANAQAYVQKLQALDAEFRAALAPAKGAAIITYHDAFPHFAARYGLRIAGVVEETPEVTPRPRHLGRLRQIAQKQGVKVIFTDAEHPQKLAEQLAVDFGAQIAALYTLENGDLNRTAYEEGMQKNLAILKSTLVDHASANAK